MKNKKNPSKKTRGSVVNDQIKEVIDLRIKLNMLQEEYYRVCDQLREAEAVARLPRLSDKELDVVKREILFWARKYASTQEGKKELFHK